MLSTMLFKGKSCTFKGINLIFLMIFIFPSSAFSHGGGLDSSGCHNDRKRGGYHCHRSSYTPPVTPSYNSLYSDVANTDQSDKVASLEKSLSEKTNKIKELEFTIAGLRSKNTTGMQSCKTALTTKLEAEEPLPNLMPMPSYNEKFKVKVKTVQSNIRKEPVFSDNIIGTVDKGDILDVIGDNSKFYLVRTSGGDAYIHKTTVESLVN